MKNIGDEPSLINIRETEQKLFFSDDDTMYPRPVVDKATNNQDKSYESEEYR